MLSMANFEILIGGGAEGGEGDQIWFLEMQRTSYGSKKM